MGKQWFKLIFILCILASLPFKAYAKGDEKVILIVMDRIGWEDLGAAHTPNIDRLIEQGGIGLMTTNTGGSLSQSNAYTTLGAGARVTGPAGSQLAFPYGTEYQGEKIENLYFQVTGRTMLPESIANPAIANIHRSNAKRLYQVNIGALGTVLKEAGYRVAVIGNCDNTIGTDGEYKRFLISMMMDRWGIVPLGEVGSTLMVRDATRPMGIKSDYEKMISFFKQTWEEADVIAIQLGDTSRAEDFRHQAMDARIEIHRKQAIEEADAFIGNIMDYFRVEKDFMMLLTPVGPAREIGRNNRVTPIITIGIGGGWLTSGSTHRRGVVTNLDVGASILNFLGLKTIPGQGGSPIFTVSSPKGLEELMNFNSRLVDIYNQRPILIKSYVYTLILILIGVVGLLLFRRRYLKWVRPLLIFIMVIPTVYLILPLMHQSILWKTGIIAITSAILLTILICRYFPITEHQIMIVCGLTVITLVIDQWTGMRLIQGSVLGYDVIAGARFYGMGNEYMGILVGATCTGGAALIQGAYNRSNIVKILIAFIALVILYTLGSPRLGANVGGSIAAFVAFSVTGIMIQGMKIHFKHILYISIIGLALLIGVFILDSFSIVGSQSHIGQTAILIKENGWLELLDIFQRKITMNLRLFRSTIWTRVFITSLGAMAILLYRPLGIFKDVFKQHKTLIRGLTGAAVGSIVALVFNDSGIVAAATAMIFAAPPFVLLIMDQVQRKVAEGDWKDGIQCKTHNC